MIMKKEEKGKKSPKFESLRNLSTVAALQSPVEHHPLLHPEGGNNDVESEIDPSDAPVSSQLGKVERSTRKLDPSDAPISSQQLTRHSVGSLVNTTLSRAAFKLLQDVAELRKIQRTIKLASQLSTRIQAEEKSPKSIITTDILKRFLKKKLINNSTDIDLYLDEPGDEFKNLKDKIHNTDGIEHAQGNGAMDRTENVGDILDSRTTDDIMNIDNIQSLFRKHHTPGEKKKLRASLKSVFDKMQTDIENTASMNENEVSGNKNESEAALNPLNDLLLTYLLKHDKSLESITSPPSSPTSRVDDLDMADDALVVKPDATNELNHVFTKNSSIDDLDMKDDAERKSTPLATSADHQKRKMNASESYIDALLKGVQSEVLDIKNYSKKEHTQIVEKKDEPKVEDELDESEERNDRKAVSENEVKADENEDELKTKNKVKEDSEMSGSGEAITVKDTTKDAASGEEKEEASVDDNDKEEQHFKVHIKEIKGKAKDLVRADAKPDDKDLVRADAKPDDKDFEREVSEILEKSKLKSDSKKDEDATVADVKQILDKSESDSDPNEEEKIKADDIEDILDESKFNSDVSGDEEAKISDVKEILEKSQDETNSDEEEAKVSDVKQILSHHTEKDKKDAESNANKETGLNESGNKENEAKSEGPKGKAGAEISTSKETGSTESPDDKESDVKPDDAEQTHSKVPVIKEYDNEVPESHGTDMKEAHSIDTHVGGAKTRTDKAFKSKNFSDRGNAISTSKETGSTESSNDKEGDVKPDDAEQTHSKVPVIKEYDNEVPESQGTDMKEAHSIDTHVGGAKTPTDKAFKSKNFSDRGNAIKSTKNETKKRKSKLKDTDALKINIKSIHFQINPIEVAQTKVLNPIKVAPKKVLNPIKVAQKKVLNPIKVAETKVLNPIKVAQTKILDVKKADTNKTDNVKEENSVDTYIDESENVAEEASIKKIHEKVEKDIKGEVTTESKTKESDTSQDDLKEFDVKQIGKVTTGKDGKDPEAADIEETDHIKPATKQASTKKVDAKQEKGKKVAPEKDSKDLEAADIEVTDHVKPTTKQAGTKKLDAKQKDVNNLATEKNDKDLEATEKEEYDHVRPGIKEAGVKESDAEQKKVETLVSNKEKENIEESSVNENSRKKPETKQAAVKETGTKQKKARKVVAEKDQKDIKGADVNEDDHVEPDTRQTGIRESGERQKKVDKLISRKEDNEGKAAKLKEKDLKKTDTKPAGEKELDAKQEKVKKLVTAEENNDIEAAELKENDRIKASTKLISDIADINELNRKQKKRKKVVPEKESKDHEAAKEKEINRVEPDTKPKPKRKKVYKMVTAKEDKDTKDVDVKGRKGKNPDTSLSGPKESDAREKKGKKMIAVMENKNVKEDNVKGSGRKNPDTKQSGAKESDAKQKKLKKVVAASKSSHKEKEVKLEKMEDSAKTAAKDSEKKDEDVKADIMDDAEKVLAEDDKMANKQTDDTEVFGSVSGRADDVKVIDISHNTESFEDLLFNRLEELKSLRKLKRLNVGRKSRKKKKKTNKTKRKHHKKHRSTKKHQKKFSSRYFRLLTNNSEIDHESLQNLKKFHKALKDEDSKSTSKEDFEKEINKFYELQKESSKAESEAERDPNAIHSKDKKVYYLKGNYTPIYFMKQLYANKFDEKVSPEKKASSNKENEETHESLDTGLMPFIADKDLLQEPPIFEQSSPQPQQLDARGGQPDPVTQQNSLPRPQVSEQYSPVSQTPDVSPSWQPGNATSVTTNNSTISPNDVRTNLIEDVLSLLHKSVDERKEKLKKKKAKKVKTKKGKRGKKNNKHHQREHIVKKLAKLIVDKEQEEIKQLEMVREKLRMVKNASVSDTQPSVSDTPPSAPVDTETESDPLAPGIILDGDPLTPITSNSQPTAASITNPTPSIATNPSSSLLPPPVGNSVMDHGQDIVPETSPFTNKDNADLLPPLPDDDVGGMTMTAEASLFDAPTTQSGLPSRIPPVATAGANPGSALYNSYSSLDPLYSNKPHTTHYTTNYTLPSPNMVAFAEQQRHLAAEGCTGEMVYGKRCIPAAKNAFIGLRNQHHINEAFVKHDPNSLTALESVPLEKQYNYGVTSMFDMPMISAETGKPIDVSLLPKYKLHGEENVAQYVTAQNRKDAAAMLVAHAQQMYGKSKTTPASAIGEQLGKIIGGKSDSVGIFGPEKDTENLNRAISMYNNALKTISGIVAKYNKTQTDGGPLSALQKPITSPLFSGPIPNIEQLKSFNKATADTSTTSTTESPFMKVVGKAQGSSVPNLENSSAPFNNNKIASFELNNIQKSLSDAAANMKVTEKSRNSYKESSSYSPSDSSSVSSSGDVSSSVSSNSGAGTSSAETPLTQSSTLLPASNDPSNVERTATEMPAFDLSSLQTTPDNSETKENSQQKNVTAATKSEAPPAMVTSADDVPPPAAVVPPPAAAVPPPAAAVPPPAAAVPPLVEKVTKPHNDLFTTNIPHARVALPQIPKEHDEHLKTLFPYNAYYPRAPPIKMSRSEQEGNHFKAEYTKYKLGLKRLADIIGKYTYKLGKIEKFNAYKAKTKNLVNKLATNANVFEGSNVDDVTGLGAYPPIPFTYNQLAKPSNAMLQYLSPTEHQTVRRTLSPTNDMQSKRANNKNKKSQQTLEDELKSISTMLEKSLSYQSLPDTIISQFTGDKRHGKSNTPYPVTQMGRYAIKGYKRHNEMVVPEWANPLKRPSPPKDWDEQYADNVKYLKLLQGDMQSSVDRFNQDIVKQQKMNQSEVDTSKKYPFKFPEDELDRLNKDPNSDSIETDMSKYMVGGKESSSLLKNISSYPFVDNDNTTIYPQGSNETTAMHGEFDGNTTQDIAANISDSSGLASNDSAFLDDGSGADVAQIQYFSNDDINKVDEVNLPLNATVTNQTFLAPALLTNSSVNDASQRHMDANVNVKGNMDQLKSLMNQMQQDIDNANAALEEQNQKKLEEKIIEDKERKEKDAKEAAEGDQRHILNNTNSSSFNTSTDNNNNDNTSSIDNKDDATETYTKDEANDTTDATSGSVRSDLDKVKALITQMQQDVFNTNAAIYAQGHQNPWPTQLAQSQIEQDIFNTNAALYKLKQSIKKKPKEKTDKTS